MTAEDAIADLMMKCNPLAVRCLRCCAVTRLLVLSVAQCDISAGGPTDQITEAMIREEVARLFAAHPQLWSRFGPRGCPIGRECGQTSEVSAA